MTRERDLHCLRHLEPQAPDCPDTGHFSGADAGGKRTDRSNRCGVRVRSKNQLPRFRKPLLDHYLMTDALAGVEETRNAILPNERSDLCVNRGGLSSVSGSPVVEDYEYLVDIPRAREPELGKCFVHEKGVLMRHHEIGRRLNDLSRPCLRIPGRSSEDLLSNRLSCQCRLEPGKAI